MYIKIGTTVTCRGGWIGRVEGLAVDGESLRISHIVVGGAGLEKDPALIPWEAAKGVSNDSVELSWSTTLIREAPRTSGRFLSGDLPGVLLDEHTKIVGVEQKAHLIGFGIADSARRLERVGIEVGWLFKRTVLIAVDNCIVWPNGDLTINQVALNPRARTPISDQEFEEQMAIIIGSSAPFKASNRFGIKATVRKGHVELHGNVRFPDDKREAEWIMKGICGAKPMRSYIISDHDLEIRLADLLSDNLKTSDGRVSVSSYLGQVVIELWDASPDLKMVVEEMARGVTGVVSLEVTVKETPTPWSYTVMPKKSYTAASSSESEHSSHHENE